MGTKRSLSSHLVREQAANMAQHREHPDHHANGDEQRYSHANYAMSFTKGLEHDCTTGLVCNPQHFEAFRYSIDNGRIDNFTSAVPVPRAECRRQWEAPTAGFVYELQGPDPQAVTMPPAPALGSTELAFEMAEVYELALLRDAPLSAFSKNGGTGSAGLNKSLKRLNALPYATEGFTNRPRIVDGNGDISRQTAFRGSSPGVDIGPYLSQFLILGNADQAGDKGVSDGFINFGANAINQRVLTAKPGQDYMQDWDAWLRVQQGYDVNDGGPGQVLGNRRFIHTPRDLATYVHFDALYQAYLNACLLLLNMAAPFSPSFANLSGMRSQFDALAGSSLTPNAGGFALYGGPHVLTLVTEVATRALKAVRYQKFNNHLRLRPEALAGRIERATEIDNMFPSTCHSFSRLACDIESTVTEVRKFNAKSHKKAQATALLPMAFAEGSPMHPSYGAGHATVAGACVTMLKAFFDTSSVLTYNDKKKQVAFTKADANAVQFEVKDSGARIDMCNVESCPLTVEGELNKLAANISIGRNMAGVHFYSDYHDSLRMGEQIALGILEEQAICYPTDEFRVTVPTFDGTVVSIGQN
ncbi:MAG: vanadium-dependent haloperoxidase [Granulosicoccus sp.]